MMTVLIVMAVAGGVEGRKDGKTEGRNVGRSRAWLNADRPSVFPSFRPAKPPLVILIVVDQLRPDYLVRYRAELTGGLARLTRRGVFYTNGLQDHAITQTAPGHATLLSGRPPASTNIITNDRGVGDTLAPLIGASGPGASPRRFRGTALYDWMRAADPDARVLSVSRKDRSAIAAVGRARADVYWYAGGQFTTSTWYRTELPPWVRGWNARRGVQALAGTVWWPLRPVGSYPERDSMPYENRGQRSVFPHTLPVDSAALISAVTDSPWMDSLTLDLALEGVRALRLGQRGTTDLLVLGLSATDDIGHRFGPDSREVHDQVLRLDAWLGWFFDSLGASVPPDGTIVALSADHGVVTMPEYAAAVTHAPGGRASSSGIVSGLRRDFEERLGARFGFAFELGLISGDVAALRARGVDVDSLGDALAVQLTARPEVARVYTPRTLRMAPATDRIAERWRRQLPHDHQWLVAAALRDGWIWSGRWDAGHGTSQWLDVTVPIIIAAPGVRAGTFSREVRTTDVAATLARLIGVTPLEPLDGRPLREVIEGGR